LLIVVCIKCEFIGKYSRIY